MKHLPIRSSLFKQNRKRFTKQMLPNSIAIFNSNDEMPTNGDQFHRFWQNSDLYWLCGIEQEDTMVILFPNNPDPAYREVLVLVRPNELKEKWDGKRLRAEEAKAISGISTTVWLDSLYTLLQVWIHAADHIYINTNENDRKAVHTETRDYRYAKTLQQQYPAHQYHRSAKILKQLRAVKTPLEIEVIQQAINITEKTLKKILTLIKPGVWEYEIEAAIVHGFLSQRASREAYNSIVASGDRALTLHYISNNQQCLSGELLLMDFGAHYGGYCADLTRTVPVNGKFTKRQKEVYNACLHIHNYAKSLLKPGIVLIDYTEKVGQEATKQFIKMGLLTKADIKNEDAANRAYRKYFYHGISHHIGIDIHDVGTKTEPLKPGMLLSVEPGIYIEEEKMGMRIENNIAITKTGNNDLMKHFPITVEEIEALMNA